MKSNMKARRIMILLAVFSIIKVISASSIVAAEVIDDSTSYHYIENSYGEIVTTIKMNNGVITLVTNAHPATTTIKWKLVGFTVTRVKLAEDTYDYQAEEGTYHLKGYKNVSTVFDSGYGTIWFRDEDRSEPETDPITGLITTTTTIDAERVEDALKGEKFNDIVQNTPIFLHGIFCVYTEKNGKEYPHTDQTQIRNWKDILLAEWWDREDRQLEDFRAYFNMQIDFQPAKQKNTLNYYTEGKQFIGSHELDKVKPGFDVTWSNEPITQTYNNKKYELYKYEVKKKSNNELISSHFIGDKHPPDSCTIDNIRSGTTKVYLGGMNINLFYKLSNASIIVNAVDKKTGQMIKEELYTGGVEAGQNFKQEFSKTLITNNISYKNSGDYAYSYTKNSGASGKGSGMVSNGTTADNYALEFLVPSDLKAATNIIVNVYYDAGVQTNGIRLRVLMVSSSGATISEISEEAVTREQAISKSIQSPRLVNGVSYKYSNRWETVYETSSGSKTITGTGVTAAFNVPATTTMGTTVVLKIYYDATQEVEIPSASGPISMALDSPSPYGVINGDRYNGSYFTSEEGIATTESQYVFVKTKDYLLGYTLVNRTGKTAFNVPVTMYYTLEYMTATPESAGGPKPVTEVVPNRQIIRVEKAYSYWEISNLDFYYVSSAVIHNYSLPGGGVTLNANNAYLNIPTLDTWHSSSVTEHVLPPLEALTGIELYADTPISSETSDRPSIEFEDLTSYAISMTGEAQVKNDSLIFDGRVVLSDTPANKIAPSPNASYLRQSDTIIHDKALFKDGLVIDGVKDNGSYSSNGNVTYALHPESVNASSYGKSFILDVNGVMIHTPVICDPVMTADNAQWSQVIKPAAGAVQIVLDQDNTLNDFSIRISNTLQHGNRLGYTSRDFSRSFIDPANISYIARKDGIVRNEMKLPFDVYLDANTDGYEDNDEFIKAGTWFVLGRDTHRFYVPMWVQEGIYTGEFRTIAVNGTDKLSRTEVIRNTSRNNYVATQTINFQVSGRIYGLTLYDISDYPNWETVFRKKNSMLFKYFEGSTDGTKRTSYNDDNAYYYTVGTRNQYGQETDRLNKYTVPLVNGNHPKYKNLGVLKTGYAVRIMLETTGEMYSNASFIKITPTFYYVDAKGGNRRRVDLYYDEEIDGKYIRLIKVGDGLDQVNIKSSTTGNLYTRIPEAELKNTSAIINTPYSKLINQTSTMYSYSQIRMLHPFRTFVGWNYAADIAGLDSFEAVRTATGQSELSLSKYTQKWYGTYKIPQNVHAVAAGYDVRDYLSKHGIDYKEDFWLTGGYIIVNFNIVTIDKSGRENLSYINANNYLNNGNCSMWVTEGANVQKTDSKGNVFNLRAGDSIIYFSDKKYGDDYEGKLY